MLGVCIIVREDLKVIKPNCREYHSKNLDQHVLGKITFEFRISVDLAIEGIRTAAIEQILSAVSVNKQIKKIK